MAELTLADTDVRLPIHQRIADAVLRGVRDGQYQPGTALPSEAQLARELGVALGTVRRALRGLEADGVIDRQQGRGTFVRQPDFAHSMLRFFRFGDATGQRPLGRVNSIRVVKGDEASTSRLGVAAGAALVEIERVRLLADQPVAWETIWLPVDAFGQVADTPPDEVPNLLYPWYHDRFGVLIAHAEETLTIGSADRRDVALLGCDEQSPMVVIERLASTLDRDPVERRITRGISASFQYRVEIS